MGGSVTPLIGGRILARVLEALGLSQIKPNPTALSFSSKYAGQSWRGYFFSTAAPVFLIEANSSNLTEIREFAVGIGATSFLLIFSTTSTCYLVVKQPGASGSKELLIYPIRSTMDLERLITASNGLTLTDNELMAAASLSRLYERLSQGAERHYINRGLFSAHYLDERFFKSLERRGRRVSEEAAKLFEKLSGNLVGPHTSTILESLGYVVEPLDDPSLATVRYSLGFSGLKLDGCVLVVTRAETLDYRSGGNVAPSYVAVSALRSKRWVFLTNGSTWRLYSSLVASPSTDYFEVDLSNVTSEKDPRLGYFVALFSPRSIIPSSEGKSVLDEAFEESRNYAKKLEDNLRSKVFDGQLFLNLVRTVLDFNPSKKYSEQELELGKTAALKLLYRILFILYAEARELLPVKNKAYSQISLENLRKRLASLEASPETSEAWISLQNLFQAISMGSPTHGVPEYDGELFQADPYLDGLTLKNKYLVAALKDLMEAEGGLGVDYGSLGVRHLGSIYEALLQYSVRQADRELVIYEDKLLEADYAADQKQKPKGYVERGALYLSVHGLERKLTGSYYTPDELVNFLVKQALEPHFQRRRQEFKNLLEAYRTCSSDAQREELARQMEDELLGIRVLDPAMGSGHFLVAAVNEITHWVIGALRENSDAPLNEKIEEMRHEIIENQKLSGVEIDPSLLTDTVILKRMVMKRCVYGVELNPLAVELAKLSLWLDSFTIGTPLTFLDHHIKNGDSLIGLPLKNVNREYKRTLEDFFQEATELAQQLKSGVSMPPDISLKQVRESRRIYSEQENRTKPYKQLLDIAVARIIDQKIAKTLPQGPHLERILLNDVQNTGAAEALQRAIELVKKYTPFHWELEFPDVFAPNSNVGFDVVLTNPPWDAVKPEDDDFFSGYLPDIRKVTGKPEKKKMFNKLLENPEIKTRYEDYRKTIEHKVTFYRSSGEYGMQGKGDTNLWKLFLERAVKLLSKQGTIGVVLPSGIVTDEGGKELRATLLEKGRIIALYEFENKNGIFPDVDSRSKFALLVWEAGSASEAFPAAFYLHSPSALEGVEEQEKFLELPKTLIRVCSPETLSIPEVRSRRILEVFKKLYSRHPLLSDESKGWTATLLAELHRTNDSDLFEVGGSGWPLIEGKHFHQFVPDYGKPEFTVNPELGIMRVSRHRELGTHAREVHEVPRLAFRNVASSTNVRSMIACLIPQKSFSPNSVTIVLPKVEGELALGSGFIRLSAYLAGIFNSYVFDFLVRQRVSANLNFFYVYQTPVPADYSSELGAEIARLAARLSFCDERFRWAAETVGSKWGPLSMRDRVRLTAKLNALVARLYGLTKEELNVVLSSFGGFEEDEKILELPAQFEWSDDLMRRFNGEVRKRVLEFFDKT